MATNSYQPVVSADVSAAIPSGQTTSAEVDLAGCSLAGLFMPAAFTGTSVKIAASPVSGGTYVTVQDGAGNDYSLAVSASKFIPVSNLALVAGLRFIKLVSGSAEAADRSIILATRPV